MSSKEVSSPSVNLSPALRRLRGADLYRMIFDADSPEEFVKTLSAQTVYLAIQGYGIESSTDLLRIVPDSHYRTFLDLQFWERDTFSEEAFWRWLEAIDQEDSLAPLHQLLRSLDPKVLAQVVGRYVHSIIGEERTDAPPGEGYFTPDGGFTWVSFHLEIPDRLRLLGRLFALVYQSSPDYFYQVLNLSSSATAVELEEESYLEKSQRLAAEGLPDLELSAKIHTPLDPAGFRGLLVKSEKASVPKNMSFSALAYSDARLEPLSSVFENLLGDAELSSELESELTLVVNAAIIRFLGGAAESNQVEALLDQVRGTINLGLEKGIELSKLDGENLVRTLGLQPLYRFGLGELRQLRRKVRELLSEHSSEADDKASQALAEGILLGEIPKKISALTLDGAIDLPAPELLSYEPFMQSAEILAVEKFFTRRKNH